MDESTQASDQPIEHDDEKPTPLPPLPEDGEPSGDQVEDSSADSFPASDPPSFTGTTD